MKRPNSGCGYRKNCVYFCKSMTHTPIILPKPRKSQISVGSKNFLWYNESMDWKFYIGIIAGVIAFIAYIVYIRSILKGETKPNKATWWIWTFMGAVIGVSYYFSGAENTIWVPFVEFIGPFSIALLSLKYGEGGLEDRTDIICLTGAIISIILWIIFKNPVVALVTNLAVDSFALIPTIKKSSKSPAEKISGHGLVQAWQIL